MNKQERNSITIQFNNKITTTNKQKANLFTDQFTTSTDTGQDENRGQ